MAWISIDEARANLKMWLDAEKAVATGQSYTIGSMTLNRASMTVIDRKIAFWRREIEKLEHGRRGVKIVQAVPRDF